MSYTAISDFKFGMDRRRPASSGVPGTLVELRNAVLTRGGDVERAKKFASTYILPAGTFGAYSLRGQLFVFGESAEPAGMPVGVRYQQLAAPGDPAMTAVLDAKSYAGKVYAVATYADGNVYHFYDGVRVTDWDNLADANTSFDTIAARLAKLIDTQTEYKAKAFGSRIEITAAVPGVGYTIATSTEDNGGASSPTAVATEVQANVAPVAEVIATGTVTVTGGTASPGVNMFTSITVDGMELLAGNVDFVGDASDTANALAVALNNHSFTSGYAASAAGAVVTIAAAPGTGDTLNGFAVVATAAGNATATTTDMAGGVTKVDAKAQVYTVDIGGSPKATGTIEITGGTSVPGTNKITSVIVNGVTLASNVDWDTSNDDTADDLATAINVGTGTHGFTATATDATVTITSDNGVGLHGSLIEVATAGDVTATASTLEFLGLAEDLWTITLDGDDYQTTGRASATGRFAFVHKKRVWSGVGAVFYGSKLTDPTNWTDLNSNTGAVLISVADEVDGADDIVGMAKYEDNVAVFARNAIIIYALTADAETITVVQPLDNTGTLAPRSIVSYGANDVFYLDETGVRSLRTRDAVQSAYASDVGSAIDPFVQDILRELGEDVVARASAVIEAADGRYMLAIGQYIVVLSQFPSSKIVAWSYIDFGQPISDMIRVDRSIYLRARDTIYAYGGIDGTVYPDKNEYPVWVETPFISAKDPAAQKMLEGFDMAAVNEWRLRVLVDPNNPAYFVDGGRLVGTTYNRDAIKLVGETSHFALQMVCSAAGFASLSSVAVHHMITEKQ